MEFGDRKASLATVYCPEKGCPLNFRIGETMSKETAKKIALFHRLTMGKKHAADIVHIDPLHPLPEIDDQNLLNLIGCSPIVV